MDASAIRSAATAICGNRTKLRVDLVDRAVLRAISGDVLRPAVVLQVIDGVLAALHPKRVANGIGHLKGELQGVERELANLAHAIAAGGPLEALLVELKVREARRAEPRRGHRGAGIDHAPWLDRLAGRARRPSTFGKLANALDHRCRDGSATFAGSARPTAPLHAGGPNVSL